MTRLFTTLILFCSINFAHAQAPIAVVTPIPDGYVARHVDGSWSAMTIGVSGGQTSTSTDDPVPQNPAPVPMLRMKWTDVRGVEHEVTTPVASTTAAGLRRAVETHKALVEAMQALYPPRPV